MWQPKERIRHKPPATTWPTEAEAAAARMYQPIAIGSATAKQRTWIPAMVPWRATEDGFVTDNVIDWYRRFAEGKPGVIVVEATGIRDIPSGPLLRAGHERFVDGLRKLTAAVKDASGGDTLLFIQLIDFLRIRRRPPKDKFLQRFLRIDDGHRERLGTATEADYSQTDDTGVVAALGELDDDALAAVLTERELESLMFGARERVTDTELAHIRDLPTVLPGLFADAAERCLDAGFDGVELHYAHAYTMASFLSARNTRDDGYGGSRENRVRLPLEVMAAVRERIGGDHIMGVRFLGHDVIEGGSDLDDAVYFGQQFAAVGVDFLSLSKGGKFEDAKQPKVGHAAYPYTGQSGYECMPTVFSDKRGPFARNVPLAAAVRAGVREDGHDIPVVAAGGLCTFEQCEAILENGDADIVAAARQSLADPDWFLKIRMGRGADIRRCEFTNYCEGLDQVHKQVTCKLWDRKQLDEPDVVLDTSGKRRLTAPRWQR